MFEMQKAQYRGVINILAEYVRWVQGLPGIGVQCLKDV